MKRTFTKRVNSVLAAVLTIVALMVGQQALAESKTVTYKFHAGLNYGAKSSNDTSGQGARIKESVDIWDEEW